MKTLIIYENKLTAQEFVNLTEAVGWGCPNLKQIETALKNTIYSISVEIDGKIIGMGRIVGDGARIFYYIKNAPRGCADRGDGVNCCAISRSR